MNELDLFDELTFIDERLILEAHETPVRRHHFGGVRRAAVLIAAVMMLVVTAVAGDWEFKAEQMAQTYATEPNTGHSWTEDGIWYSVDNNYYRDYQRNLVNPYVTSEIYSPRELQYYVACEGCTMQITLEAMILFDEERLEYKKVTSTQDDKISLTMDSFVDGEDGTIVHVRKSLQIKTVDGWREIDWGSCYLPTQLRFEVPYGLDARFPDMQYNYDGRNSAVKEPE